MSIFWVIGASGDSPDPVSAEQGKALLPLAARGSRAALSTYPQTITTSRVRGP